MTVENKIEDIVSEYEIIPESKLYAVSKSIFKQDFMSGLPCGELRNFISESASDQEIIHIQSTNEREAVGLSQGAWLAGKKPALYMQNSGLFEASNDIASLLIPCETPVLFAVSWRGAPGETATQHLYTGSATQNLLKSFGVPYVTENNKKSLLLLREEMYERRTPGVILLKRERFNAPEYTPNRLKVEKSSAEVRKYVENNKKPSLTREGAIEIIFDELIKEKDAVISSTGLISRSIYSNHDGENQFYNAGAFGLTSMIGLGFSIGKKDVKTYVIEGDGSVLTNLGALNVAGHYAKENFTHIVLDNGAYVSCSGEETYGSELIPEVAALVGYQKVFSSDNEKALINFISESRETNGPTLIHIKISKEGTRNFKRPLEMAELSRRFRNNFNE